MSLTFSWPSIPERRYRKTKIVRGAFSRFSLPRWIDRTSGARDFDEA